MTSTHRSPPASFLYCPQLQCIPLNLTTAIYHGLQHSLGEDTSFLRMSNSPAGISLCCTANMSTSAMQPTAPPAALLHPNTSSCVLSRNAAGRVEKLQRVGWAMAEALALSNDFLQRVPRHLRSCTAVASCCCGHQPAGKIMAMSQAMMHWSSWSNCNFVRIDTTNDLQAGTMAGALLSKPTALLQQCHRSVPPS